LSSKIFKKEKLCLFREIGISSVKAKSSSKLQTKRSPQRPKPQAFTFKTPFVNFLLSKMSVRAAAGLLKTCQLNKIEYNQKSEDL